MSRRKLYRKGALSSMMRVDRVDKEAPLDERIMEAKPCSGQGNKVSEGQKGFNHGADVRLL